MLPAGSLVRLKRRGQEASTMKELMISGIRKLLAAGMCVEDFMRIRDCRICVEMSDSPSVLDLVYGLQCVTQMWDVDCYNLL
jgi:hypothetical protein